MKGPEIPDDFSLELSGDAGNPIYANTTLTGDTSKPIATSITGDASKPIGASITGDKDKPIATLIIGDPKQPVTTDNKLTSSNTLEILNLPRFTLQDIKDMMKVRVRIPNYSQVCFKLMGVEFFSICMSGEGQVITEPYVPNAKERCEDDCCEPDTRPFPEPRDAKGTTGQ